MTDFAQERSALRSRGGPSLPKLNLLPASQYLQQHQHYAQPQHPFDTTSKPGNDDFDIDMDMDMDFDTTPVSNSQNEASATSKSFISAHPSPDTSDESDCEQGQADETSSSANHPDSAIAIPTTSAQQQQQREQAERQQIQSESPLSHHLFLTPVPIPKSSRTPPHSPLNNYRQRSSFSTSTPPGSASSVLPAPCSDSVAVDALIREHVRANMVSHATDKAFFWHVGKLSEFSFSDRFVRSRMFEIKDSASASIPGSVEATDKSVPTNQQAANSWRLRLYPHGRGDRHRDSEYVGLYLQQDAVRTILNRRSSAVLTALPVEGFSSSAPTPFIGRGSFSPNPRRSISGASSLPPIRRHVTLFIATENGDCLAKQDLIEWFSGSEGGLGFPRMVSRKTVQDAVKNAPVIDDDEEECELGIVAGVIFHDL